MTLARWRKTGLVAVLAVTAAFGGLEEADHVTPVALGATYDTGALVITPRSVEVTTTLPWIMTTLAPECRFVVLDATVTNTADEAAPMPTSVLLTGTASDCTTTRDPGVTDAVVLADVPNNFAGALRVRHNQSVPIAEPGFTEEMQLAWVVPDAELRQVSDLTFRLRDLSHAYSTFRISRQWLTDEDHYGQVSVPNPVAA